MKKFRTVIALGAIAAITLTGCSSSSDAAAKQGPLVVQFVPTRTDQDMQAQAQPLADLLSKQLGREVKVNIATDYSTIIEAMSSGKVDVGIMPPASYVLAHDAGAADAILQAQIPAADPVTAIPNPDKLVAGFHGEILVKADSDIKTLADLKGKSIATQSAASASGYIFPIVEMAEAGLDINKDVKLTTVAGIDSSILAVLDGTVDAAFSFEGGRILLKKDIPDITDKVRVLYLTKSLIPNDAIAVNTKLDAATKDAVKAAFLAIAADPAGLKIISTLYSHRGYVPADEAAYDVVRDYIARASKL
ncbi:phosphate/phosphite/phosphonate ABC transporter substrate-binding protein [Nakamurella antarctica]|uniref:Phosphate/phosphite/phosphonate ABC transporter substrate-binding protein n=1 Tax=Nakamurella antarctica TaxID=1902245 RepID=A0A3G8ZN83_9ACTN|nr:phosphate/phosphite/phosphonate ABC transporter substrate-binding protein [Nakamurella antarctica]AZI58713.1 phosphate/phosphite/phosphonate ABC transporter substrate-binding protein [Nakamurella antarctica]